MVELDLEKRTDTYYSPALRKINENPSNIIHESKMFLYELITSPYYAVKYILQNIYKQDKKPK